MRRQVAHSSLWRKRMGHIELAAPVVHIWFFKDIPSSLGTLLDIRTRSLERIIYYQDYVVVDPADTPLKERQLLTEDEFREAIERYKPSGQDNEGFQADTGAEAVRKLLMRLDLVSLSRQLRQDLAETSSEQKIERLSKRLKVVEAMRDSGNRPEWMVLDCIPVIPPTLRPLILQDSGRFIAHELNFLYKLILDHNRRLRRMVELHAPEIIIRNDKRRLQQSVDVLFDNSRSRRPVIWGPKHPFKSLTTMITGKHGRLRKNLLFKRVEYSTRSVVVVGPDLKLHQCGLPKRSPWSCFSPS